MICKIMSKKYYMHYVPFSDRNEIFYFFNSQYFWHIILLIIYELQIDCINLFMCGDFNVCKNLIIKFNIRYLLSIFKCEFGSN